MNRWYFGQLAVAGTRENSFGAVQDIQLAAVLDRSILFETRFEICSETIRFGDFCSPSGSP
jgi:hypothetical protein